MRAAKRKKDPAHKAKMAFKKSMRAQAGHTKEIVTRGRYTPAGMNKKLGRKKK